MLSDLITGPLLYVLFKKNIIFSGSKAVYRQGHLKRAVWWRPPLNKQWGGLLGDEYIRRWQGAVSAVINVAGINLRRVFGFALSVLAQGLRERTGEERALSSSARAPSHPTPTRMGLPGTTGATEGFQISSNQTGRWGGAARLTSFASSVQFQDAHGRRAYMWCPRPSRRSFLFWEVRHPGRLDLVQQVSSTRVAPGASGGTSRAHRMLSLWAMLDGCPRACCLRPQLGLASVPRSREGTGHTQGPRSRTPSTCTKFARGSTPWDCAKLQGRPVPPRWEPLAHKPCTQGG